MASNRRVSLAARLYALAGTTGILDSDLVYGAFVRAYFLYKRHVEDPFAALAARYPSLFRNGHVLDIGANVGYTATVFHRVCSPSYSVFAFEPDERNARMLRATIARYHAEGHIVPIEAAVGAADGSVDLWHNRAHGGDHRIVTPAFSSRISDPEQIRRVRLVTIDRFLAERGGPTPIAFIKIDVQGYELAVCQGMTDTLVRHPQAHVAIEYAPGSMERLGFDARQVEEFFLARDYTLSILGGDGTLHPYDRHRIDMLGSDEYVDLLCSRQPL